MPSPAVQRERLSGTSFLHGRIFGLRKATKILYWRGKVPSSAVQRERLNDTLPLQDRIFGLWKATKILSWRGKVPSSDVQRERLNGTLPLQDRSFDLHESDPGIPKTISIKLTSHGRLVYKDVTAKDLNLKTRMDVDE